MLHLAEVDNVATKAVLKVLQGPAEPLRVMSKAISDSQGQEALQVTIVLKPGGADHISGDMALDTLVTVDKALRDAGEDRFPVIEYATEEELASSDDTEP